MRRVESRAATSETGGRKRELLLTFCKGRDSPDNGIYAPSGGQRGYKGAARGTVDAEEGAGTP